MSNLEHYFENLLFLGKDVNGDWNRNSLTKEEQNAVEECAQYVLYTLFNGRNELKTHLYSDAVEVVRCEKCKYLQESGRCDKFSLWVGNQENGGCDDFYCGYGEPKEVTE